MSFNCAIIFIVGKNDGSVNGVRYFQCRNRHGIFVRHDRLIPDKKWKGSRGSIASPQSAKSPSSASIHRSMGNLALTSPLKDNVTSPVSSASPASVSRSASFMRPTAASSARHLTASSSSATSSSSTPKQK